LALSNKSKKTEPGEKGEESEEDRLKRLTDILADMGPSGGAAEELPPEEETEADDPRPMERPHGAKEQKRAAEALGITYSAKRKFWLELCDLLQGTAFPFIIMVIFSSTIIAFTASEDLVVSLIALIGGEALLCAALIMFGRANGSEAYRKTVENDRKRLLGSSDEKTVYCTGEYSLVKGAVIGLIVCVPFLIFQTVELCIDNDFCMFCLEYVCAWAYCPFSYLGKAYMPLNYMMIIVPVALMTLGYHLGKLKQIKIQEELAKTNPSDRRSRVTGVPEDKKRRRK